MTHYYPRNKRLGASLDKPFHPLGAVRSDRTGFTDFNDPPRLAITLNYNLINDNSSL